jgi:hypothetical protein
MSHRHLTSVPSTFNATPPTLNVALSYSSYVILVILNIIAPSEGT